MKTEKNEPWKHVPHSAETKAKISASMRGKNRGNTNAAKPKELHRISISVSLAPETLARLRELSAERKISVGKLIDELVTGDK